MIKVMFVCYGNICRSTMAESVFTDMIKKRGIQDQFEVSSAATNTYDLGNPVHRGTVAKLNEEGIPVVPHIAVLLQPEDGDRYDYFIGMDDDNIVKMKRILGEGKDIRKLLSFAGETRDIDDPYYTGYFDQTYEDVVTGLEAFLEYLGY